MSIRPSALIADNIERAYSFARVFVRSHPHVDADAAMTAALDGLEDAARSYKADHGSIFWTYAKHRIRGRIRDLARVPALQTIALENEPSSTDDRARQRLLIWSIIAHLDDRGRHIVIGHYFKNQSMHQLADELGLSVGHLRKLHNRIVSSLRLQLAGPSANDNGHRAPRRDVG